VEAAVAAFGLKSISGSDGEISVKEDVSAIGKGYRIGDSIPFTCSLKAVFDPEMKPPAERKDARYAAAIDAEVIKEE
jgi:hypothetical protein